MANAALLTRSIGKTNLVTTELGFGCAGIGGLFAESSYDQGMTLLGEAWQQGLRFFDTAPEYGHGLAERRVGDFLRQFPENSYLLSTKVGELLTVKRHAPAENKFVNKLPFHLNFDYSYSAMMRACEDSLQRLGCDRIHLLLVHDLDGIVHSPEDFARHLRTYLDSGYRALVELREQGVINAFGLGVKQWEVCARVLEHGPHDCFMLQGNFTLLEQNGRAFLDRCLCEGIGVLLAGPFASGILATGAVPGAHFHHQEASREVRERVQAIARICALYDVPLTAAALQFPLRHPAIASVVMGARTPQQLADNVSVRRFPIPEEFWHELERAELIYSVEIKRRFR